MSNFPKNFEEYFSSQPERYIKQLNKRARIKNILWFIVFATLAYILFISVKTGIVPVVLMYVFAVIALIFGVMTIWGSKDFFDKETNGFVLQKSIKKFDSDYVTEIEIYEDLQNRDFDGIAQAAGKDNQPLQIYIYEDKVGKRFYILLMKYFSNSELKGISDVVIIDGPEYDRHKKNIYKIKL